MEQKTEQEQKLLDGKHGPVLVAQPLTCICGGTVSFVDCETSRQARFEHSHSPCAWFSSQSSFAAIYTTLFTHRARLNDAKQRAKRDFFTNRIDLEREWPIPGQKEMYAKTIQRHVDAERAKKHLPNLPKARKTP